MEPGHMDHKIDAYGAVSPLGHIIPSTIRWTADQAWGELRASLSDSERLHKSGWRVHQLECTVKEAVE